jgi:hypothetical protein
MWLEIEHDSFSPLFVYQSISLISTKRTIKPPLNLKPFITKKTTTYGAENPGPGTGKNIIHSYSCLAIRRILLFIRDS